MYQYIQQQIKQYAIPDFAIICIQLYIYNKKGSRIRLVQTSDVSNAPYREHACLLWGCMHGSEKDVFWMIRLCCLLPAPETGGAIALAALHSQKARAQRLAPCTASDRSVPLSRNSMAKLWFFNLWPLEGCTTNLLQVYSIAHTASSLVCMWQIRQTYI